MTLKLAFQIALFTDTILSLANMISTEQSDDLLKMQLDIPDHATLVSASLKTSHFLSVKSQLDSDSVTLLYFPLEEVDLTSHW